jgi:multimeric flavodoxin WrbA
MKILGISGSPRDESTSGTFRIVKTVLEATGLEYDLVSLRGKAISGCIACCRCASDNVCKVEDDMKVLRDKIIEADAYVVGGPNYHSGLNSLTSAFFERFFQFRHREGNFLWGKLAVAVGIGGTTGTPAADKIERSFLYHFVETVAKVSGQGAASCYYCGYGDTCKVGIRYFLYGENAKTTPAPDVMKDQALVASAIEAGRLLGARLRDNHDRKQVTAKMHAYAMERFKASA